MLAAIVAGILLSYYDVLPFFLTLIIGGIFVVLLLGIGGVSRRLRESMWDSAALVFLFVFSMWNTIRAVQKGDWYGSQNEPVTLKVHVLQTPIEKAKSWQVQAGLTDGKKVMLYLQKDSTLRVPDVGDWLLVRTTISHPQPADEFSFDYGEYLLQQGFAGSGFVPRGKMVVLGHEPLRGILPTMQRLRDNIERRFSAFAWRERSVLEALLLGDRRHLAADTREAFSASGAMHVLAVSGLHVGIITHILLWVVTLGGWRKPLYEERKRRYFQVVVVSGALIFYAFLTGLSPSVCRSVLMFILLCIGSLVRSTQSRYNDLAASAVIILLARPLSLMMSGFLLSYSAVLSIIRFYPSLRLKRQKNKFVSGLWDLVVVSICAQLGTLPWTIFFFHRTSNYFILTNLGVLPLVETLLIPTFFVFIVLAPLPFVGTFVGKVLEGETWVLNEFVSWVQSLPGSTSEVYLNVWLTAILISIVVCMMLRWRWRWIAAMVLTAVFVCSLLADYHTAGQKEEVRYYYRGQNATLLIRRGRNALLQSNDSTYAFSATHDYRLANHIRQTTLVLRE